MWKMEVERLTLEKCMNTIIVYVDEASYALRILTPMLATGPARAPTRWIVLACAPRLSRHVSKWVTHSQRESWRGEWSSAIFGQLVALLQAPDDSVITRIAEGKMCEQTDAMLGRYPGARVLDARRPKFGQDMDPVTRTQPVPKQHVSGYAAAFAGAALLIAAD
jgi:hypothetical protein